MIENKNRTQDEAKSIQVAEESRELDWKSKSFMASMFMGELDLSLALPFPLQSKEDREIGDEIISKVKSWADKNLDGDAIDKDQEIPAHGSTAATLSAHQSIGVPQPLKLFGTEEQKQKYLPRIAAGELTAFALTEPGAGSDPANMITTAVKQNDGSWLLNGEKLWCTNGTLADLYVVMARTVSESGKKGITAFVVEGKWEGVEVVHRCRFLGIRAVENGLIRFNNVRIPAENVILGEGKGLKLALTTLNDGRLGIPAVAAFTSKDILTFSASWAKTRSQWGKHIGNHEAGAQKLADIAALSYAMETFALYGAAMSDRHDVDIRMEAAAAKMWNSERSWELTDTALQLRAGRGFETESSLNARGELGFPMERALRDTRINRIVEGTTDIMHLFLAREALDGHLKNAGGLFRKGSLWDKLKVVGKCALIYPGWYLKTWIGSTFSLFLSFDYDLRDHMKWIDGKTRSLARTLFHQMILKGPKLEMRQGVLGRLVDIGAELAVMALVAARHQGERESGDLKNKEVVEYFLTQRRIVVDALFAAVTNNADKEAVAAANAVMFLAEEFPKETKDQLPAIEREFCSDFTSGKILSRK